MSAVPAGEEQAVAIPWGDGGRGLEGVFTAGGDEPGGAVIAPPHPLYGGSMDSPVVNELAFAFRSAGLASLCFNWRGVGASAGSTSGDAGDADEDYAAALAHLEQTVGLPILACGYSFGAVTALRVAAGQPRVKRLVLVAPPLSMLAQEDLAAVSGRALVVAGERDRFAPAAELEERVATVDHVHCAVVPGADHFFATGLAEISREVAAWLGRS